MKDNELLKDRIATLEQDRELLSAKLLINDQILLQKVSSFEDMQQTLKEEIDDLKEVLDKKEFLLQKNEQKYNQYEKVLRDLILNQNTDENVREQLREKMENKELAIPKDEWKITSIFNQNRQLLTQLEILREENKALQLRYETEKEKAQMAYEQLKTDQPIDENDVGNQTYLEQLSIFQNKEIGQFDNLELKDIKKDKKYVKKLEATIDNLNQKLSRLKENFVTIK